MTGYNCDLDTQRRLLCEILSKNKVIHQILCKAPELELGDYYIGAGSVCQTVWNYQNGLDPMHGISDIDFVYFDTDLSYEKEDVTIKRIKTKFADLPIEIDIKNEARVHLWFSKHFGYEMKPYLSVEDAINTWPTTASSVGVRIEDGELKVYAPYGLNDMFGQIVRANKVTITKDVYEKKCEKWLARWDTLKIIKWQ